MFSFEMFSKQISEFRRQMRHFESTGIQSYFSSILGRVFPGIGQPKTTNTFIRFLGPLMLNKYSFLAEVKKLIDRSKSFCLLFFFKKLGHPGLFSIYFLSFQINITILRTNVCDKCPSSIWWWDSNATSFRIWVSFHNH